MNDLVKKSAKKLMEIMEGCHALAQSLGGDDEDNRINSVALIELMHHFTFEVAPVKAQIMVNEKKYPY